MNTAAAAPKLQTLTNGTESITLDLTTGLCLWATDDASGDCSLLQGEVIRAALLSKGWTVSWTYREFVAA